MKLILVFTLIFLTTNSFAFNWEVCKKQEYLSGVGEMGFSISSTQFSSSWGGCAAIGSIKDQKKLFVAKNIEELQIDISRGRGEYLEAYASLSGCDQGANKAFSELLQKNYARIYGDQLDSEPKAVYEAIEKVIGGVGCFEISPLCSHSSTHAMAGDRSCLTPAYRSS